MDASIQAYLVAMLFEEIKCYKKLKIAIFQVAISSALVVIGKLIRLFLM